MLRVLLDKTVQQPFARYMAAKDLRARTMTEQWKRLFDNRATALDPAYSADWRLVPEENHCKWRARIRAKAELFAKAFALPTPEPTLRVSRHTSTPKVTLPDVPAALRKTQRKKAPGPDGVNPEYLRDAFGPRLRVYDDGDVQLGACRLPSTPT